MARDLYNRYVWLVDTIKRRGRITRRELDECWKRSKFGNGSDGLCRRTFYNYRNAIAELFDITIEVDPATYEYYISEEDSHNGSVTDWLLNSSAVSEVLSTSRDISDRIYLENVPSAREYLALVFDALRTCNRIRFNYHNYSRLYPTQGVVIEPYFARIFKQRWYVIGRNISDNKVKTYALDRITDASILAETFEMPEGLDIDEFFGRSFGITVLDTPPSRITLRTDHRESKYLRALPLHHSQQEVIHDGFSLFYYNMQITDDLVREILSYGSRVTVVSPPELRERVAEHLRVQMKNYGLAQD